MRITILGSTGRTGLPLVDRTLDAGHDVVAFARTPSKLGDRRDHERLTVVAGDLLADSREHVDRVVDTDLDWTVVRPPRLTEGPSTGDWEAGSPRLGLGDTISRADLAAFVLACVEDDEWVRELPMVAGG